MVNAVVPLLDRQVFGLGIPETIGSAETMMLLIHPDAEVAWSLDSVSGRVTTTYVADSLIAYDLALIPGSDYVDLDMTIRILTDAAWTDVFAFNCISPARADPFRDSALERTYISVDGRPRAVGGIAKTAGPRPSVSVYPTHLDGHLPPFAEAFETVSAARADAAWVVVTSADGESYMAATTRDAAFLFNNTRFGCIHAAPSFGDIAPGGDATTRSRVYFSKGGLGDFLERVSAARDR